MSFIFLFFILCRTESMNIRMLIFTLCPIPEDQKPITEYIALKKNEFFTGIDWITEISKFKLSTFFFFLISFLISPNFWWVQTFLFLLFFSLFFLSILFWSWNQIKLRFEQSSLFYEEASWYDGQIWEKPFSILKNDRLISTQQLSPIVEKIRQKIFLFSLGNLVFLFLFLLK